MKYEKLYKYLRTAEFWGRGIEKNDNIFLKKCYARADYKIWIEQSAEYLWNDAAKKIYKNKPWLKG